MIFEIKKKKKNSSVKLHFCSKMAEFDSEGMELSLGLSLNGRFGVDPKSKSDGSLKRWSSSTPNFLEAGRGINAPPLGRTWSLPVEMETEEEMRKRKEKQMLHRLEAKRKRSEKQMGSQKCEERREIVKKLDGDLNLDLANIVNGISKQRNLCHGFGSKPEEKNGLVGAGEDGYFPLLSQASSVSSGLSELESQKPPPAGMSKGTEAKSPQSVHSFSEQKEYHPIYCFAMTKRSGIVDEKLTVNTEIRRSKSILGTKEMVQNMLEDMPCVSTKGDGPNGKRVEGFLYGYRKGEEVRILCVCHGSFLSPAEFIKHAGGGDVEHPLRHIVVNPSPCSSFAKT